MRKYLIIFLLIFFAAKGNCQISEKYEMTIGLDYLAVYLTDTGFVRIKSHVLNHGGDYSKGSFEIIGDTLKLKSSQWNRKQSRIEILDMNPVFNAKKSDSTFVTLDLKMLDNDSTSVSQCFVYFFDEQGESIGVVLADKNGKFYFSSYNKTIRKLIFGVIGLRPFEMKLADYYGYSLSAIIHLEEDNGNSYNDTFFQELYLIDKDHKTITKIQEGKYKMILYSKSLK
jgi:hypothetical protein